MTEKIKNSTPENLSQNVPLFRMHPGYPEGTQMFVTTPRGRQLQVHSATVRGLKESGLTDQQVGHELDTQEDVTQEKLRVHREKQEKLFPKDDDYYETENPLAGDIDSVIANYEQPQHPNDAHRDEVARQHGD